jgi:hypothetical protein
VVYFHTGLQLNGRDGDPSSTLDFASWWLGRNAFNGPPRFPSMPDPSDFSNGAYDNVCAEAIEGCYITVGQSIVNPRTIYDWTFFRSPVVIPVVVSEPGMFVMLCMGLVGFAMWRRDSKKRNAGP